MGFMVAVVVKVGAYLNAEITTGLRAEVSKPVEIIAVSRIENILNPHFNSQIPGFD